MLHRDVVEPRTLDLLKTLMQVRALENFYLVGGTALALMTGHRQSIDLDLFTKHLLDIEKLRSVVSVLGTIEEQSFSENVIYQILINGIKVDFVSYRYEPIDEISTFEGVRLAGLKDISAMKVGAIAGRGEKKDFFDLVELLGHFSISEMMSFYMTKFPSANLFHAIKSLTYFRDAERDPEPLSFRNLSWQTVKKIVSAEAVKNF
jgi:predicted nucleotidyltransferase component of viral defense system